MNPAKFKETTCPRCNTSFKCFLFKNCWCEDVVLTDDEIDYMQLMYGSCLCKKCLLEAKKESVTF